MGILSPEDVARAIEISTGEDRRVMAIVREVAALARIDADSILSDDRKRETVLARDLVCFVARQKGHSLSHIGRTIGRDHTSVMAAVRREEARRG